MAKLKDKCKTCGYNISDAEPVCDAHDYSSVIQRVKGEWVVTECGAYLKKKTRLVDRFWKEVQRIWEALNG